MQIGIHTVLLLFCVTNYCLALGSRSLFFHPHLKPQASSTYTITRSEIHNLEALDDGKSDNNDMPIKVEERVTEDLPEDLPDLGNIQHRLHKRSTKNKKKTITVHTAPLHDGNQHLIIHWAGKNSSVIVVLTKNMRNGQVTKSYCYFSYDYGKTYKKVISSDGNTTLPRGHINMYYHAPDDISRYIFADTKHKAIYTTMDSGKTIKFVNNLQFNPDEISMHPSKPSIVLAQDRTSAERGLYKSDDFGSTWMRIQQNVVEVEWGFLATGNQGYDKEDSLYVQRREPNGKITVLRTETYFQHDVVEHVLISNVNDFKVMNASMFATRSTPDGNNELWLAPDRHSTFMKAVIPTNLPTKEFYVIDAADSQIMICVNHGEGHTNLYISEKNRVDFTLSLQYVTYFNPEHASYSSLSLYAEEAFADIYKVHGMRSIYIANIMVDKPTNHMDRSTMHSVITFDKGGMWQNIPMPEQDDSGNKINCSIRDGCSLQLTQQFHSLHPATRTSPMFSQPSAPGFVFAQGNAGKTITSNPDLFFSSSAGKDWVQVLSGLWYYTWGDHGGVLVALRKFKKTNVIWYSTNEGEAWDTFQFADYPMVVYGLMTEPGETKLVFTVFGSSNDSVHSWVVTQVNLTNIFTGSCTSQDYKDWSPSDERGINCLLGSTNTYRRRRKHSSCTNGLNYDRPVSVSSCPCNRDDFECAPGFSLVNDWGIYCRPSPNVTFDVYQIPPSCYAGGTYKRTKGYRKLAGDLCSGGEVESHYAPDTVPCPIGEDSAFMILSTNNGVYRVDMASNTKILLTSPDAPIAVFDYDYKNDSLYWKSDSSIYVTDYNATGFPHKLLTASSGSVVDMALDWVGRNLFYANGSIFLVTLDGKVTRPIVPLNCTGNFSALAVDPDRGFLYAACNQAGHGGIYRMAMDGSNLTRLVTESTSPSQRINGLTLDVTTDRLYWSKGRYIKTAFTNGNGYRSLTYDESHTAHSLSVYKNKVFWAGNVYSLQATDKYTSTSRQDYLSTIGLSSSVRIYGMKIWTLSSQAGAHNSICKSVKCSQICVPVPAPATQQQHSPSNPKCLCGVGGDVLVVTSSDGHESCSCPIGQTLDQSTQTCKAANGSCLPHQFLCGNGRCILSLWRCDGEDDCLNGKDEMDCKLPDCTGTNVFTCDNRHCIPKIWMCDHENDCKDGGSDERNCNYTACNATSQFTCTNGRCKPKKWRCDGDNDCGDWSDEMHCNTTTAPPTSNGTTSCNGGFRCSLGGLCLPRIWHCDGDVDCPDGSDEHGCSPGANNTCLNGHKRACANGRCIYRWWFCDGTDDCGDGSDELHCNHTTPPPTTTPSDTTWCKSGLHCAATTACYPIAWRCDGVNDCGDYSDEYGCNGTGSSPSVFTDCAGADPLRCHNGRCIFSYLHCDGTDDCGDGSDEYGCARYADRECVHGDGINYMGFRSYTKGGKTCQRWSSNTPHVPRYRPQNPNNNYCRNPDNDPKGPWCYTMDSSKRWQYCGIPKCQGNSSVSPTPPMTTPAGPPCADGYFYCGSGSGVTRTCVVQTQVCDGSNDCGNNADELNCDNPCTSSQFRCANHRCVEKAVRCNGVDDCLDNSDEVNCSALNCQRGYRSCANKAACIPERWICNGFTDCEDGSDEKPGCVSTGTSGSFFTCVNGKQQIRSEKTCDHKADCSDASDEQGCVRVTGMISCGACGNKTSSCYCLLWNEHGALPSHKFAVHYMAAGSGGLTAFNVSRATTQACPGTHVQLTKDIQFNTKYNYVIYIVFKNFSSQASPVRSFTTVAGYPSPPRHVITERINNDGIMTTWDPPLYPNGDIQAYKITATSSNGKDLPKSKVLSTPLVVRSYTMLNMMPGNWTVTVKALGPVGYSPPGKSQYVFLGGKFIPSPGHVQVKHMNLQTHTATLTWSAVSKAVGYLVEIQDEYLSFYHTISRVNGSRTFFNLTKLAPSQPYKARVKTIVKGNLTSAFGSFVYFQAPHGHCEIPVLNVKKCKKVNVDTILLDWSSLNAPVGGASSLTYKVAYGTSSRTLTEDGLDHLVKGKTSVNITGLHHNMVSFFQVQTYSPYIGPWSPVISLKPKEDLSLAPLNLRAELQKTYPLKVVFHWDSSFMDGYPVGYRVNVTNPTTKKIWKTFLVKQTPEVHVVSQAVTVQADAVYSASVQQIISGVLGEPATRVFATSGIQPPTDVRLYNTGYLAFEINWVIPSKMSSLYTSEVRAVRVILCDDKDVKLPTVTSCHELFDVGNSTTDAIIDSLTYNKSYTVFLQLRCRVDCNVTSMPVSFQSLSYETWTAPPAPTGGLSLTSSKVVAIAVSALFVIICVTLGVFFLIRRRRNLHQSYSTFASSHYDPQSGEAYFVGDDYDNGLDDVDAETPMISGFADDEPLIVA